MKIKTDNNLNADNTEDDDALSLRDLQFYDHTATSSILSSPRTSSSHELFEFLTTPPNPNATGDIVFCGKVISGPVDEGEDNNAHARRIIGSSSLRLPDRQIEHVIPMRSVSSRDIDSPRHGVRFPTAVKKVNVTALTAMPSKSKRRMFMFGPVRFTTEMEMSSIRERQGRRTPSRMFPVAEGVDARKTVTDAGTDKNQRVRCSVLMTICYGIVASLVNPSKTHLTSVLQNSGNQSPHFNLVFRRIEEVQRVEDEVEQHWVVQQHRPSTLSPHMRYSSSIGFFGEMENPAANQLPEADSLPDGFVDSSAESPTSLSPTPDQVADYKEEKLVEVDSRPDLVVDDFQSCEGDDGSAEQARTFPVELSEDVSCDTQTLVKTPLEDCRDESDVGSPDFVSENVEQETPPSVDENKHAGETCQNSGKSTEQGVEMQAAHVQGILSSESSGTSRKDTSEVKRKSAKHTFKSEKEFLEFTLSYQKVLSERDAAISMRDKLESLCRELQRQNKMLMDECKRVSTESQNLRLELSNKFQEAIKDVTIKLEEQRDDSLTQLKENEMLRSELKQKEDQIVLIEQQHAHQLKQKTLELQIADLKIQQHEENLVKEQSQMKMYAEQVSQLLTTEKNLRLQLTSDGEKFQQFQDALVKSNQVFETFKQEIEKMTKSIKELKKENTFLKSKTEKSDVTLIQLVEERERMKKQLEKTKNQKEKLESLCRSLQAERKQNPAGQSNADSVTV
ncbi:hypothetical protein L1987_75425 [Smallanthus sonchifolius]|uniref:Uncharacterized protein n=1 Tax=Smallanthus sonchifolius TaxID=185202 RepID=A0ACB9A6N4_9ASTR|nr:hypothetical protein L1987_75425 [Smallanthus sonchifolius]